ncbi:MAG: ParB N-terminal domain-containing protein [Chloroflexota bacterium]
MAKNKFNKSASDPFADENKPQVTDSWWDASSQIFGELAKADAQIERVHKVSIFEILPDLSQPRRAIPSSIRQNWDGTPGGVKELFTVWWGATQQERGQAQNVNSAAFDLGGYLEAEETERSDPQQPGSDRYTPGPVEGAFMKIITLAASIRRDGLTNPVTIAPLKDGYQLETGERRWLAFHLLHAWFDGSDGKPDEREVWMNIPARKVERIDVWRQASENNVRADLNAIGKARQYAVLMMDMHDDKPFRPIHTFDSERAYYAQAAELSAPYGRGEELLTAMGARSRSVLTRLRALLTLPDEIWQGGDDFDLPEDLLYSLAKLAQADRKQAIARYRQIVLSQNNSATPTQKPSKPKAAPPGTRDHFVGLMRAVGKTGKGRHKDNAQALKALRELRAWIDEQESRISDLNN